MKTYTNLQNNLSNQLDYYSKKKQLDMTSSFADQDRITKGFNDIGDTFDKGGMDPIMKTMFKGFAAGANIGYSKKRNEDLKKYDEVVNYLEEQNFEIEKQLKQKAKDEMVKEKLRPKVLAYLKVMDKLNPANARDYLQRIFDENNRLSGSNFQYVSRDDGMKSIITLKDGNTGQISIADLGLMVSDDEVAQKEFAEFQTSAILKRQAEQDEKDRKAALELMKLNQTKEIEDNKIKSQEKLNSPQAHFNNKAAENESKRQMEEVIKSYSTIDKATKVNNVLKRLKQIGDENPEIFNSFLKGVWTKGDKDSFIQSLKQKGAVFGEDNKRKSKAISEFDKLASELVGEGAKGFGSRANVFIEKIFQKSSPALGMQKDAFDNIVNDMIERNSGDIKKSNNIISKYNNTLANTGVTQLQPGFQQNQQEQGQTYVKMNIGNGKIEFVPKDKEQAVLDGGGSYAN